MDEGADMRERLLVPGGEAYWLVGLGRSKFYEYVAAGEIEIVKVGRRTLVPQESLRAFVERLRGMADPELPLRDTPAGAHALMPDVTSTSVRRPSATP